MARTLSNMLPLGTKAPEFRLINVADGNYVSLQSAKSGIATVIMFICNHCPYVKLLNPTIASVSKEYMEKGIAFIAISSNDVENYPDDSPEKMKENAIDQNFNFPYLFDETQNVARAYDAACTPDFYIFDNQMNLVYRGQFDDARPGNGIEPTGKDLTHALNAILSNSNIDENQKPSIGCNIKWKKHESDEL
jgi:peroxiredoxin